MNCVVCGVGVEDGHCHGMSAEFLTKKANELKMKQETTSSNPKGREETSLEKYKLAIKDARHIFTTYKDAHPDDAWECLRKILFNKALK